MFRALEHTTDSLFEVIDRTTREVASTITTSTHTKRWWTKELTTLRRTRNRASTEHFKWRSLPDQPCHKEYKIINRNFGNAIERPNRTTGKNGSNTSTETAYRRKTMDRQPQTPNGTTATTTAQKAKQLASTLFPLERPHNVGDHRFDKPNPPELLFPISLYSQLKG
jgi:D-mannonate dehydratase